MLARAGRYDPNVAQIAKATRPKRKTARTKNVGVVIPGDPTYEEFCASLGQAVPELAPAALKAIGSQEAARLRSHMHSTVTGDTALAALPDG